MYDFCLNNHEKYMLFLIHYYQEKYEKLKVSYECEIAYRKALEKTSVERAVKEFAEFLKENACSISGIDVQGRTVAESVKYIISDTVIDEFVKKYEYNK